MIFGNPLRAKIYKFSYLAKKKNKKLYRGGGIFDIVLYKIILLLTKKSREYHPISAKRNIYHKNLGQRK